MEKDRNTKIIALSALFIAVVGLTVGFASFSNSLTISSSAQVTADASNFDVNFSTSNTSEEEGIVTPTVVGATGLGATISNEGSTPTIKGLKANFTAPGQSVKYSFYTHNNGLIDAYLKNVTFNAVTGLQVNKKCTGITGTTQALVDAACEGISITATVHGDEYSASSTISGKTLAINEFKPVEVVISYAEGSAVADGDFNVEFGDISLTYSSVN